MQDPLFLPLIYCSINLRASLMISTNHLNIQYEFDKVNYDPWAKKSGEGREGNEGEPCKH